MMKFPASYINSTLLIIMQGILLNIFSHKSPNKSIVFLYFTLDTVITSDDPGMLTGFSAEGIRFQITCTIADYSALLDIFLHSTLQGGLLGHLINGKIPVLEHPLHIISGF